MLIRVRSLRPDATAAVAGTVATHLGPGDVLVLDGPLGAGKTRFVQGVAAGLGVPTRVTSPTFVLVRRHAGRIPLVHVDAYRLEDPTELLTIDDEIAATDVVTCIEWGTDVAGLLPAEPLACSITIDGTAADAPRIIELRATGPRWTDAEADLARALGAVARASGDVEVLSVDPVGGPPSVATEGPA